MPKRVYPLFAILHSVNAGTASKVNTWQNRTFVDRWQPRELLYAVMLRLVRDRPMHFQDYIDTERIFAWRYNSRIETLGVIGCGMVRVGLRRDVELWRYPFGSIERKRLQRAIDKRESYIDKHPMMIPQDRDMRELLYLTLELKGYLQ